MVRKNKKRNLVADLFYLSYFIIGTSYSSSFFLMALYKDATIHIFYLFNYFYFYTKIKMGETCSACNQKTP